jgi:hypothetical protein
LARQAFASQARSSVDEVDKDMAMGTVLLEKELNIGPIMDDYPLMKFFIQLEMLKEIKEREERESRMHMHGTSTFR